MAHSILQVANKFIALSLEAEQPITPMQVQKLAFISQGFMLALHDRPLIDERFAVWQWGPVNPGLYQYLKQYSEKKPIKQTIPNVKSVDFDDDELNVVKQVWNEYGSLSGFKLSDITHIKGSPWRSVNRSGAVYIDEDEIKDYYKNKTMNGWL